MKGNTTMQSKLGEMRQIIETIQETSIGTEMYSTRSYRLERAMKVDSFLETFDDCFDFVVINNARSGEIISFLSKTPLLILMNSHFIADALDSKMTLQGSLLPLSYL